MYGYDQDVGDVVRPYGQSKVTDRETGFSTIPDVAIRSTAEQKNMNSTNLRTGQLTSTNQLRGQIQVSNRYGRKVMIMGYKRGAF